jgi:serine/threonine protein kinase/Tol biopolymer transport system component
MPLTRGEHLGPYEIVEPIGKGGMGEVYRARDPRIDREVAIKISAAQFGERFEREARAVAALNHPNICTLYDVGPNYLVMELVEGPTLADRIKEGPIPLDEALRIAQQIADALEAAHNRAVVHRDLKPGNVKLRHDGTVKVLDFGLAKIAPTASSDAAARSENSPTLTIGMTEAGAILGTAAYMPPEQARGKPVDKRADIWSFGVVLYEMLTGERLFQGEDVVETLAAVVHKQPDLSKVPERAQRLLRRCLEKDPRNRLRDITGMEFLLEEPPAPSEPPTAPTPSRLGLRSWFWPSVAAFIALALMPINILHLREQPPERQILRYTLPVPEKTTIQQFAVSPDGHYVGIAGSSGLSVRPLESLQTQALAGTEGATYPFWSPDSRYIGFFAQGKLNKISVTGGPPQALCDAGTNPRGGTWNRDGVIVFSAGNSLSRVPAAGGVPIQVSKPEGGQHRHPVFLPDGHRFLYVAVLGKDNGIYLGSIESSLERSPDGKGAPRRLVADESQPDYFDGHLLFVRDGTLMAQPVDPKTMNLTGDLFPVAEKVSGGTNTGDRNFSVSGTGLLVYLTGTAGGARQHLWFDRAGKELGPLGGPVSSLNNFALSPDAKRVVVQRQAGSNSDLWMSDLEHGTEGRFTFDASVNGYPVWSPDGSKVAFTSTRAGGVNNLYQRASNGTGQDELLLESKDNEAPWDWSRDGRFLVFSVQTPKGSDLWALPVIREKTGEKAGDKKPIPLLQSDFSKTQGQLSPDSRWLAYTSTESGRPEVYVVPFSPSAQGPNAQGRVATPSGKWQVSIAGGTQPRWRADGREMFYMAPDQKLMAVEVKPSQNFDRGTPQALFTSRSAYGGASVFPSGYVPSPDGKRFLIVTAAGERGEQPPLTVVVNWLGAVKKP